jgi:hypothetical protein
MIPKGIEPATFRIVAQRLTNCAIAVVRGRATAVGGGSSNRQASAPGYIKLVAEAEILKLLVSV